jgi:hypothetical protein
LEDIGWDYEDHRHFYRVFHESRYRTQASICLSEQNQMAFYYLTITSRTADGRVLMTWNYPFSYGLKLQPHLLTNRFPSQGPFSIGCRPRNFFAFTSWILRAADPSPEKPSERCRMKCAQIAHNVALGLRARGDHLTATPCAMFYLWFQFLRDS